VVHIVVWVFLEIWLRSRTRPGDIFGQLLRLTRAHISPSTLNKWALVQVQPKLEYSEQEMRNRAWS
jgi:hypothetical protein